MTSGFVLSACLTEVARLMVGLVGAGPGDSIRPVGSQHAVALPELTADKLLLELRGQAGTRFVAGVADWSEVGLGGEDDAGVLYKLTSKSRPHTVYYFAIRGARVCRIARDTA